MNLFPKQEIGGHKVTCTFFSIKYVRNFNFQMLKDTLKPHDIRTLHSQDQAWFKTVNMATPFLLTGVTGGLGAKILDDMLNIHRVPASNIVATSRSEKNKAGFESKGLTFRVADYNVSTLHVGSCVKRSCGI